MTAPPGATGAPPARVLAVLDDAFVGTAVLEASAALAQVTHRELHVVYVESAAALLAAALPATRVLAHAAAAWAPFEPRDVERGWRVQVERVRALAQRLAERRTLVWSLRVARGALNEQAGALLAESDLLLVGTTAGALAARAGPVRVPETIVAIDDGSPAGREAERLARALARELGVRLELRHADAAHPGRVPAGAADLLVLPRSWLVPPALAALRVPALLVGEAGGSTSH
jgi:hypothetical protein